MLGRDESQSRAGQRLTRARAGTYRARSREGPKGILRTRSTTRSARNRSSAKFARTKMWDEGASTWCSMAPTSGGAAACLEEDDLGLIGQGAVRDLRLGLTDRLGGHLMH